MPSHSVPPVRALGLMSGTSADGLSIALGHFGPGRRFKLEAYKTYPYPAILVKKIRGAVDLKTPALSQLNFELGAFYGRKTLDFLRQFRISAKKISAAGSHGQTVYHGPADHPANTLQIGEPSLIAEMTGIPVVADFRPQDIAAGGGGAPLIPFFDDYFFTAGHGRALQNIGGIANVTFLRKGAASLAFDNGPGNALMDAAVLRFTRGRQAFDRHGALARRGKILAGLLMQLKQHPYFRQKPPKSTGKELFCEQMLPAGIWKKKAADVIATLTLFTAWSIADSYWRFAPFAVREVIVSGGGTLNPVLMSHLQDLLRPARVLSIEALGLPSQAKEPLAFAFLALRAIQGKTNHLPSTTGARHACVLGKIIHAHH